MNLLLMFNAHHYLCYIILKMLIFLTFDNACFLYTICCKTFRYHVLTDNIHNTVCLGEDVLRRKRDMQTDTRMIEIFSLA